MLCYAHFDVQPPEPLDEWVIAAVRATERNQNIYARGAVDDKGQLWMEMKALESLLKAGGGKLPINVEVLFEGEEEVGGEASRITFQAEAKLKADFALVTDTELFAPDLPTLCVGLRGLVYTEIEALGAKTDLHSGMYGGAAPNPFFGADRDHQQAERCRGQSSDPWLLRQGEEADRRRVESLGAAAL